MPDELPGEVPEPAAVPPAEQAQPPAAGPPFAGHDPRECGGHRTAGPHRAWCHDCGEWCRPDIGDACKGCRLPAVEAEAARFRRLRESERARRAVAVAALRRLALEDWMSEGHGLEGWHAEFKARREHAAGTLETIARLADEQPESAAGPEPAPERTAIEPGGYFAKILFFGHIEHVGYVTEITSHGAVAAYHVDLPDKVWGGNPDAEVEYAASAYFGKQKLSEDSVRKAWEAACKRAERAKREREEWDRRAAERALAAGTPRDDEPGDEAEPQPFGSGYQDDEDDPWGGYGDEG